MNKKRIEASVIGAICLVLGWGASTMLHECGHLAVAHAFGYDTSLGPLTLTTGSVFVHGELTDMQTALIAVAGSLALIIVGVALVRLSANPALRMVGIVFLCRSWVDMLPFVGFDGGILAGSTGYVIAMIIVVFEVLLCGGVILDAIPESQQL